MAQGKQVFIKDIIYYLFPPYQRPASIAPSFNKVKRGVGTETNGTHSANGVNGVHANGHSAVNGVNGHANGTNGVNGTDGINGTNGVTNGANGKAGEPYPYDTPAEPGNPMVMPKEILSRFHFAFLIRDPHNSVPSYYRCTIPPLDDVTGFHDYYPSEAGYDEVRRTFEYLRRAQMIGPHIATRDDVVEEVDGVLQPVKTGGKGTAYESGADICVVEADEMLQKPAETMEAFCRSVGIKYDTGMLKWDNEADHEHACAAFEKWKGFHDDVIESKGLGPKVFRSSVV